MCSRSASASVTAAAVGTRAFFPTFPHNLLLFLSLGVTALLRDFLRQETLNVPLVLLTRSHPIAREWSRWAGRLRQAWPCS